ncbi:MAG: hypothetical protein FJ010_08760 [Chloroflexi bacterium]|nr:hypothetical protein [Chloroflexota bacterium]
MSQTITINLPDTVYSQLKRAAELFRQPTEAIIAQSLAHSLPPLLEEIPFQYQPDILPLLQMSDASLQIEMQRAFPQERWSEYEILLDKKKTGSLTRKEEKRLDDLRREADLLTFRRGYAAVLLKRRGYRLPTLQELEQSN